MDEKRHIRIPVFIPQMACPHACVYCNQKQITGQNHLPPPEEVTQIIEKYLPSIPSQAQVELAFFGGNFTALALQVQEAYLKQASSYLLSGKIEGIRLSTRPDDINEENLCLLKHYGVKCIELGTQSMDDEVLALSERGHSFAQVEKACRLILAHGFSLGLQMMIGLPGDTEEKLWTTARRILETGAKQIRIYPCLVIKQTKLALWYKQGKYSALSLEKAVEICKALSLYFEKAGIRIIRMGLHPSEGLLDGTSYIAGPFHPSFRELVETEIWYEQWQEFLHKTKIPAKSHLKLWVNPKQWNAALGYHAKNRKFLEEFFYSVKIYSSEDIVFRNYKYSIEAKKERGRNEKN